MNNKQRTNPIKLLHLNKYRIDKIDNDLLYKCATFKIIIIVLLTHQTSAQQIAKPEVPKEKAGMYSSMIAENSALVSFIENTMVQHGLPKLLRNLALIESGFNKNVVSNAGAGGLWQFTVSHAGNYGLSAQNRFDIYKSTKTAAQSLKDLYEKYKNWIAVVAAYNCGESAMDKAMLKAGSNRYDQYYTYLPAETIGHVHKFMMACSVTNEFDLLRKDYCISAFNSKKHRLGIKKQIDPALAITKINGAFDPLIIAEVIAVDINDLNKWNPELLTELALRGEASLYLPVDVMPDFLLLKSAILHQSLNKKTNNE
ncbi:MAG: lytic murein transglycosylase [Thiothrix sp.]|nr:MAG: lytic murein transglycosylase [Thiothrix sp.]